ncbi:MAG: WecB/TagA/CpsF family glycosyltransferase [Actinobacteria bacterium]|nr:WecB/TagA/CpsF family glycosyltransferase [Actinomycetota bacterium]
MWSPKTASALRESMARNRTFGALKRSSVVTRVSQPREGPLDGGSPHGGPSVPTRSVRLRPMVLDPVEVLGVPVGRMTTMEAIATVERAALEGAPALVVYVNAHTLNTASKEPAYRRLLGSAAVVLNDGAGLSVAGRLYGKPFPENLNGSDFNPEIARLAARHGWSLFLLGARPGVADRAAERLVTAIPELEIAGTRDGFFERSDDRVVAAQIQDSGADVVMVAMGNPLQERWLAANLASTGARLGVGVGAFFDFTAGEVPRSPRWMNRLGIEWIYRLLQEPRRMWRRYILGNPAFLVRIVAERVKRPARPSERS